MSRLRGPPRWRAFSSNLSDLMSPKILFHALLVSLLLGGCAAPPFQPAPLGALHPANPRARESAPATRPAPLADDELTARSRQQLAAAGREQQEWEKSGPTGNAPTEAPTHPNHAP